LKGEIEKLIGKLKGLFKQSDLPLSREKFDEKTIAVAAILVEAASIDGDFSEDERSQILGLLTAKFFHDPETSESLLREAELKMSRTGQIFGFTQAVSKNFSYEERVELMQSIWEVVLSDGRVDAFEDQLVRRLGGLIHVSDRDRALARRRAESNTKDP
jgi:uncharacterized tellurite resistance protein B-like protein